MNPPTQIKVVPRGLEPRTLRLLAVRSDQLSYETDDILFQDDLQFLVECVDFGSCGKMEQVLTSSVIKHSSDPVFGAARFELLQSCAHNAPIFRLLLKVAVSVTHQCN